MPPNERHRLDLGKQALESPYLAQLNSSRVSEDVNKTQHKPQRQGQILLVGAGPGDPDLLTLAAYKAISTADLVVSDRLIPQPVLDLVKCELRIARKSHGGHADEAQNELNHWCLEALREGKKVVRLKIGDPFLFGRGGEEVLFFREKGFECTVIPGVSSSLSAPLMGNIPPTHRGVADQVLIVTGQGRGGSIPELPTYSPHRTTIFLMAVGRLPALTADLISAAGFPADCPAAIIENATLPTQRVIRGTLTSIAALAAEANIKPPACFVVGQVVNVLADAGSSLPDSVQPLLATATRCHIEVTQTVSTLTEVPLPATTLALVNQLPESAVLPTFMRRRSSSCSDAFDWSLETSATAIAHDTTGRTGQTTDGSMELSRLKPATCRFPWTVFIEHNLKRSGYSNVGTCTQ